MEIQNPIENNSNTSGSVSDLQRKNRRLKIIAIILGVLVAISFGIFVLLSAIIVPNPGDVMSKAGDAAARSVLQSMKVLATTYFDETGSYQGACDNNDAVSYALREVSRGASTEFSDLICNDSQTEFAASGVSKRSGTTFCIDINLSIPEEIPAMLQNQTSCN